MSNELNDMPFTFIFLDEEMPACFKQIPGMSFAKLISNVSKKDTDLEDIQTDVVNTVRTQEEILSNIKEREGSAFYDAFERKFAQLKSATSHTELRSLMGNFIRAHGHSKLNNLLRFSFSKQGRIDLCYIEKDGAKFCFILNVGNSQHEKNTELNNQLRYEKIAEIISGLFNADVRFDPSGDFRKGLLAYKSELLKSVKTPKAQFETLMTELERVILSHDNIPSCASRFKSVLEYCSKNCEEGAFENHLQEQLSLNNIPDYKKIILKQLMEYDSSLEQEEKLSNMLSKIKLAQSKTYSFCRGLERVLTSDDKKENDIQNKKDILDCFEILHAIPESSLNLFKDFCLDVSSEIEDADLRKKINHVLTSLPAFKISVQGTNFDNPLHRFTAFLNEVKNSRMPEVIAHTNELKQLDVYKSFLSIKPNDILKEDNIDIMAYTLIKMMVEDTGLESAYFDEKQKEVGNKKQSIASKVVGVSDFASAYKKVLDTYPNVASAIIKKYPVLKEAVLNVQQGDKKVFSSLDSMHSIFEMYRFSVNSLSQEDLEYIQEELKKSSPESVQIFKKYLDYCCEKAVGYDEARSMWHSAVAIIAEKDEIERLERPVEKTVFVQDNPVEKQNDNSDVVDDFKNRYLLFLDDVENRLAQRELVDFCVGLSEKELGVLKKMEDPFGLFAQKLNFPKSKKKQKSNPEDARREVASRVVQNTVNNIVSERRTSFIKNLTLFIDNPHDQTLKNNLKEVCFEITQQDFVHLLNKFVSRTDVQGRLGMYFLDMHLSNLLHANPDDEDETVFEKSVELLVQKIEGEKKDRINHFRRRFEQVARFDGFSSALDEDLFLAADALSLKELDECILQAKNDFDVGRMNCQEEFLLSKVKESKQLSLQTKMSEKNTASYQNRVKEAIQVAKRRARFQHALGLIHNKVFSSRDPRPELFETSMALLKSDIDDVSRGLNGRPVYISFVQDVKNCISKAKTPEEKETLIKKEVTSFALRLRFYLASNLAFSSNQVSKPQLIEIYSTLDKDSREKALEESRSKLFDQAILVRLDRAASQEKPKNGDLVRALEERKWELDFYQKIDEINYSDKGVATQQDWDYIIQTMNSLPLDQIHYLATDTSIKKPDFLNVELKESDLVTTFNALLKDKKNEKLKNQLCEICTSLSVKEMDKMHPDLPVEVNLFLSIYTLNLFGKKMPREKAARESIEAICSNKKPGQSIDMMGFGSISGKGGLFSGSGNSGNKNSISPIFSGGPMGPKGGGGNEGL